MWLSVSKLIFEIEWTILTFGRAVFGSQTNKNTVGICCWLEELDLCLATNTVQNESSFTKKYLCITILLNFSWLFELEWQMPRHDAINLEPKSRLVMIRFFKMYKTEIFEVCQYLFTNSNSLYSLAIKVIILQEKYKKPNQIFEAKIFLIMQIIS